MSVHNGQMARRPRNLRDERAHAQPQRPAASQSHGAAVLFSFASWGKKHRFGLGHLTKVSLGQSSLIKVDQGGSRWIKVDQGGKMGPASPLDNEVATRLPSVGRIIGTSARRDQRSRTWSYQVGVGRTFELIFCLDGIARSWRWKRFVVLRPSRFDAGRKA
jgi:hypothetical protein